MKTIIAGSRDLESFKSHERIWIVADAVIQSGFTITEVVSGGARGIDLAGELYAETHNPPIPITRFIPDWSMGRGAGFVRNRKMAEYAQALVLIWNGTSRGSANMGEEAAKRNLRIFHHIIP